MDLNYSEFHPLDHRIGSRYCRDIRVNGFLEAPIGWKAVWLHAKYWWLYKRPGWDRHLKKVEDDD